MKRDHQAHVRHVDLDVVGDARVGPARGRVVADDLAQDARLLESEMFT